VHYLIDGYNLLFRLKEKKFPLEKLRQEIILVLNEEACKHHLKITLIFDAARTPPVELNRGHYEALEIVYTAEGQLADDYILEVIEASNNPLQIAVVTSDLKLAKQARHLGATTLLIREFLTLLLKKAQKKKKDHKGEAQETEKELKRLQAIFEKRYTEENSKQVINTGQTVSEKTVENPEWL
jgi:uncharacterized protein